jgi:hypothetical protein
VSSGNEHLYKLSVAIAEQLILSTIENVSATFEAQRRWAGLQYPAIELRAHADNLALLPWVPDTVMKLERVDWNRVEERPDPSNMRSTMLDIADSISADGAIEWKGRTPQTLVPAGATLTVTLEDGQYVARDADGSVVEPF